ncbi:hypothetical protein [Agromyces aureus]|nr:hypothetical protein [Agromyces aureus]
MTDADEMREFIRNLWGEAQTEHDEPASGIFTTRPATPTAEQEN